MPLVLEGVGARIEYFVPQVGGGLTYIATSETIISTGLTITGAQILQV